MTAHVRAAAKLSENPTFIVQLCVNVCSAFDPKFCSSVHSAADSRISTSQPRRRQNNTPTLGLAKRAKFPVPACGLASLLREREEGSNSLPVLGNGGYQADWAAWCQRAGSLPKGLAECWRDRLLSLSLLRLKEDYMTKAIMFLKELLAMWRPPVNS